ncbi:hypothetical protein WME91_50005 [Sorangium sp. So ce269]
MTYHNNLQSPVSSDAVSRLTKPPQQSPVFPYTTEDLPASNSANLALGQFTASVAQLDPGVNFAHYIIGIGNTKIAEVIAVNDKGTCPRGLKLGMEYWKIYGDNLKSDQFDRITVRRVKPSASGKPPFTTKKASFCCPLRPVWIEQELDAKRFAQNYKLDENHSGFRSNIQLSADGKRWVGTIDWMKPSSQMYVFTISTDKSVELRTRTLSNMKISSYTLTLAEVNTLSVPTSQP